MLLLNLASMDLMIRLDCFAGLVIVSYVYSCGGMCFSEGDVFLDV